MLLHQLDYDNYKYYYNKYCYYTHARPPISFFLIANILKYISLLDMSIELHHVLKIAHSR